MLKKLLYKAGILSIILLVLILITGALLFIPQLNKQKNKEISAGKYAAAVKAASVTTSAEQTEKAVTETSAAINTTAASTTAVTTSVSATTVTTTAEPVYQPERYVGDSPNGSFYQENLFIAGDSITLGLKYYGFIPREHSIAGDSVSMWNLDHFSFTVGNEELGLIEAVEKEQPKMLYMWIGMNDVNLNSPKMFIKRYSEVIDEIREKVPGINIIVAAITPVSSGCKVVRNDIIRDYNAALMEMVKRYDTPEICFFDAYSIICDEKLNLTDGYSSGDGMHLYIPCYTDILTALFSYLDSLGFRELVE